MKIRVRIVLWSCGLFLLLLTIYSWFLYSRLERRLYRDIDQTLKHEVFIIKSFLEEGEPLKAIWEEIDIENSAPPKTQLIYGQIRNTHGNILTKSASLINHELPLSPETQSGLVTGKRNIESIIDPLSKRKHRSARLITAPIAIQNDGAEYIIQIGISLRLVQKTLRTYRSNMLVAILGMVLLSLFIGLVIAKKAMDPVQRIIRKAEIIDPANLAERLPSPATGDEIDELVSVLNKMLTRLEGSFEKMKRFAGDISHELRTPLTTIKGELELLLTNPDNQDKHDVLVSIMDEVDRLVRLTKQMLLLTRLKEAQEKLSLEDIDLTGLLEKITEPMKLLAKEKKQEIQLSGIEEYQIKGDRAKLKQLFINLIDNAISYTPPQGMIQISLRRENNYVLTIIQDTGVGIAPEQLPFVFDFASSTGKKPDSTSRHLGLGLSIARGIAELHRGSISVESEPGKGSAFTVSLPLTDEA